MNFKSLMSSRGRLNRQGFWLTAIALGLFSLIAAGIGAYGITHHAPAFITIGAVLYLLVLWPNIAIAIKRNHDHDRSGWFLLLILVPLANIWLVVELYFVRGTVGPNRFGPDPLAGLPGVASVAYAA